MTAARVEIFRRAGPGSPPRVMASATLEVSELMTPAASQPVAPSGPLDDRGSLLAYVEAFGGLIYVAIGDAPDPTREPRALVLPYPARKGPTLLAIGPGERIAVILARELPDHAA